MRKKKKLVCGVGINDADYVVGTREVVKCEGVEGKRQQLRICPFYRRWADMLKRCYSRKYHESCPTYSDCYVCEEWLTFSNFKAWMEKQDWEGKQLDKDILNPGNKEYSPETCIFVDKKTNIFLTDAKASRGEFPIGVCWHRGANKFQALCGDGSGKQKHLGCFNTELEAHKAWLAFKLEQAKILAAEQSDPRVAKALIERYSNYAAVTNAGSATGGVVSSTFRW